MTWFEIFLTVWMVVVPLVAYRIYCRRSIQVDNKLYTIDHNTRNY